MASGPISSDATAGPAADLVDRILAHYVEWREDSAAVGSAYRRFRLSPPSEQAGLFSAYLAALDQEEAAARCYAGAIDELARCLRSAVERCHA